MAWLVCASWSAEAGRDRGSGIPSTAAGLVATATWGSSSPMAGRKSAGIHRSASASRAVVSPVSALARIERFSGCKAALSADTVPRTKRSSKVARSAFTGSAAEASVGNSVLVIQAAIIRDKPTAARANRRVLSRPERRGGGGLRAGNGFRAGDGLRAIAALAALESPILPRRGGNQNPPRISRVSIIRQLGLKVRHIRDNW
jgi:hypothetical protein